MSRNEDFENTTWSMSAFEDLSPEAVLLWLWSWSNPRCGIAGLYDVGRGAMSESKVAAAQLDHALAELAAAPEHFRVLYVDGILFSVSRLRRWRSRTAQSAKSVVRDLLAITPDHPLRAMWMEVYGQSGWLRVALSEAQANHAGTSGKAHANADHDKDSVSLTRSSDEPQSRLQGRAGAGSTGESGVGEVDARATRRADPDSLPSDFPPQLAAVVGHALEVLLRVQSERGGDLPTVRGVALAVRRHPDRDHLKVAGELEHWSTAGNGSNRPVKDWPRQFAAFLDRAPAGSPTRASAGDERQKRRARGTAALTSLMSNPPGAPA